MTEEEIKKVIQYNQEIESIYFFLDRAMPSYGFDLISNGCEYMACGEVKEKILEIVKERKDQLEKELEEM